MDKLNKYILIWILLLLFSCDSMKTVNLYDSYEKKEDPFLSFQYKDVFTDSDKSGVYGMKVHPCKEISVDTIDNFSGSDQQKKVGVLSGGERNRLHLAMTLKTEANVLLLDEPTNDIDVNTLRALEEGVENFAGCAVVISHDRWFLDRICTHILAFEGDSEVYFFEGSYSDYEENRKKRLGADIIPQRIKYKKLTR